VAAIVRYTKPSLSSASPLLLPGIRCIAPRRRSTPACPCPSRVPLVIIIGKNNLNSISLHGSCAALTAPGYDVRVLFPSWARAGVVIDVRFARRAHTAPCVTGFSRPRGQEGFVSSNPRHGRAEPTTSSTAAQTPVW